MEHTRHGIAIILSGASGTGKSTVCDLVRKERSDIGFSISCTTRTPRPGEIDGVHYYFLSVEAFKTRLAAGEFLEHAEVHGNFYGTLKSELTTPVLAGKDVILDIDVQGAAQIRELCNNDPLLATSTAFVFFAPPSFAELERRLRGRQTETEEAIQRRLHNARNEMKSWRAYDYLLVNHNAPDTAKAMIGLIDALHLRTRGIREACFDD